MTTVTPPSGAFVSRSETRPVTRPVVSCARAIPPVASNSATPKATAAPPRMRFIRPLFRCIARLKARLAVMVLWRREHSGCGRIYRLAEEVRRRRVNRDDNRRACGPGARRRLDGDVRTAAALNRDGD